MPNSRGFDAVVGRKASTTWGTAVDVNNANDGLCIISESLSEDITMIDDASLCGSTFMKKSETGTVTIAGAIETNLKYEGLALDFAMCMGRTTTPAKMGTSAKNAYLAEFSIKDELEGYMVSLAIDKQIAIYEYDSVKYNGFTISGAAGDKLKASFDLIAKQLRTSGQTTTTMVSITEPLPRNFIRYEEVKFLMDTASNNALATGVDDFYPSDFSITLSNSLTGVLSAENDPYIDEPLRSGFGNVNGSFTIPKYRDTVVETAFRQGTEMKLAIRAVSSTQIANGGGGYYYEFSMYCPSIKITSADRPVGGPDLVPASFEFIAYKPDSAPLGMNAEGSNVTNNDASSRSTVTEALVIETTNITKVAPITVS